MLLLCSVAGTLLVTDDQAFIHLDDTLFHAVDKIAVMRADDNSGAVSVDLIEECHDGLGRLRIEVAGRLVGDDQFRVIEHGAGNGHTLLLTTGKFHRHGVGLIAKAYCAKYDIDHLVEFFSRNADDLTGKCDVFFYGLRLDQSEVLIDDADLSSKDRDQCSRHLGNAEFIDDNQPFSRLLLTGDAFHQSGFSGSAFADDEHKLTVADRKCHSAERIRAGLVCLMYIFKTYQSYPFLSLPVDISALTALFLFLKVGTNHRCQLEKHGIVERSKVETSDLLYFIETVYQGITVYEKFSRGLTAVEVILEETLDRHQCIGIQ